MNIILFFLTYIAPANYTDRNTWVIRKLKKIPKGKSIIDIGAGEMPYKAYCKKLNYKSQDFGKYTGENIKIGRKSGKFDSKSVDIISDIINIPVKNNSYDYVLCTEVLEHISNPLNALKEISRINKNGLLIERIPRSFAAGLRRKDI